MAVLLSSVLTPIAKAEGSRDMFPSGASGNRGHIEWRNDFTSGFRRRTLLRVFANEDEYILVGASTTGVNLGDIEIFYPGSVGGSVADELLPAIADFTCTVEQPGRGFIASRSEELAGPVSVDGTGNTAGYQPCYLQAPTTGVYYVAIYGASGKNTNENPNEGVEHSVEQINTGINQNAGVSAWDVTVRNTQSSTTDIEGRLHTFNMAFNMGQNQVNLYSSLYPVTVDGFRYRIDLNGVDPFGFSIFGNQLGNLDSDGMSPLYHDVLGSNGNIDNPVGGVMSASPQYPIFFNEIDPAVLSALPVYDPLTGIQTSTGFPLAPILPVVSAPLFAGNLAGATSSVGAGGNFFFDSNLPSGTYEIVISGDGVDFDPYGPNNKLIRGFMTTSGLQTVAWDGFANGGTPFPTGTFPYKIEIRGGEYHFPMSDVENNPFGGPIYNLLNAANPRGNTVGFYDHRGYVTSSGVTVADRNPADGSSTDDALCGDDPPNPPAANLVDGSDSAAPGFNRFGNLLPEGNTNVQCTGTFGDTKTLDLWTYFPSDPPQNALIVIKPTDFGDAPDTSIDGGIGDYTTLLQHNGPRHGIAPLLVYLGQGATDEPNGFVDGVDDQGNGTDDADDAFVSLAPIPAGSGSYTLNTIPVNNDTSEPATLYAWIDFNRNGEFESSEYAQSVVAPGDTTTALSWAVPALTSDGISYARFRLTTDALSDDETTADLDERSMGGAADGEVEDYSIELNAVVNGPKVLLVKRVTAISNTRDVNPNDGTVLNQFMDLTVGAQADDDNHLHWPTGYLLGALDGGVARPVSDRAADSVEYTIYFLSVGATAAHGVLLCDRIPPNTQFLPDAYTHLLPAHPLSRVSEPLGIALDFQGTEHALTGEADGDAGYYFPANVDPAALFPSLSCDGPNDNGVVVVDVGLLPPATSQRSPLDSYGALRFQVQVR